MPSYNAILFIDYLELITCDKTNVIFIREYKESLLLLVQTVIESNFDISLSLRLLKALVIISF